MSNWWGQPRPEASDTPSVPSADGPASTIDEPTADYLAEAEAEAEVEVGVEVESDIEVEVGADAEATPNGEIDTEADTEADIEPVIELEPVATRDGLPTMAQLDALSAELDEIDAALAAMDADPSLPARATTPS